MTAQIPIDPKAVTPLACDSIPSNRLIALVQTKNHISDPANHSIGPISI
jgi:hypothetical protein